MHRSEEATSIPCHPLGQRARVLLASVFGPYAQDDEFGSRVINPMELYHNQITRVQHAFSLRMFHRSWGLMMIQSNIEAPCTLLDFPTRERFLQEVREKTYDIIGISAIQPNHLKVAEMCRLIRQHQPDATIVVGGHVANLPLFHERIDADHVVRGEGVRWFRQFLGEDVNRPIRHPRSLAGINGRTMGVKLPGGVESMAAVLIPSVGCPMGCNFCATSAMFGGKGKFINFYETGEELFEVMCDLERELKVRSFFVMDENFLFQRDRALRLLDLMRKHNKSWELYCFSSARVVKSYTMEQLIGLGVAWIWMGLEGKDSQYGKLNGVDTHELVRTLQANGITILGSSIIGLEDHTPENLPGVIEHAVSHNSDFHQFMLYTPLAGTPLFREHLEKGTLLDPECRTAEDIHGQLRFAHRHPHIPAGQETQLLLQAFERDFEVNGPSILRLMKTTLNGYLRYGQDPDPRIRERYRLAKRDLQNTYAAAIWAASIWYRKQPLLRKRLKDVLQEIYRHFGWHARLAAWTMGPILYRQMKSEYRRLAAGQTYEPQTWYEQTNQDRVHVRPVEEPVSVAAS